MAVRQPVARMTLAEYLAAELTAEIKHEYVRGEIYEMTRGTLEHAALTAALGVALGTALHNKRCRVFAGDARVRIEATDTSTYPDLSVVCGELLRAPGDAHSLLNPLVLCEVLSDSTEAYDRGAKASHYRHIPSLREYVLVSQSEPRVEVQRRNAAGNWEIHEFGPTDSVTLESLGVTFSVSSLYRDPLAS